MQTRISPDVFTYAMITLVTSMVIMGVTLVFLNWRAVRQTPAVPSILQAEAAKKPVAQTASIKMTHAPGSVERGAQARIELAAPSWATCTVEGYAPDEQRAPFSGTSLVMARPGAFVWTWRVPMDAFPGRWTIRLQCGNESAAATEDVALDVH